MGTPYPDQIDILYGVEVTFATGWNVISPLKWVASCCKSQPWYMQEHTRRGVASDDGDIVPITTLCLT